MIYLDYNSTTPTDERVLNAMLPYFKDEFANPASDHAGGLVSKKAVDIARNQIANLIGARDDEIIFTSGATESNNIALFGLSQLNEGKKNHIITSSIEHPAILSSCKLLEERGFKITYIPVSKEGIINVNDIKEAITDKTFLVSIMFANNETGTIQPIRDIGVITREKGVFFHVDVAQAVGHIPIAVDELNLDLMSISAHKFYGPKGIGALFARNRIPRVKLKPIILGGGQERGFRSGTLNVPAIVGFGKSCEIAKKEMKTNARKFKNLTENVFNEIKGLKGDIKLNGNLQQKLAHTLNIEMPGIDNKWLSLKMKDFCFATGSACSALQDKPSHVLLAMGLDESRTRNCIRIGVGINTTDLEIESFTTELKSYIL